MKYQEISQLVRFLALACSFVECLLFAGIIFGWPALAYILKKENIFGSFCVFNNTAVSNGTQNNGTDLGLRSPTDSKGQEVNSEFPTPVCHKQDELLYLSFTISIIVYQILAFPLGWLFDRYGLRVTRLIASILFFAGIFSLIFITPDISWILFPANICISLMCVLVIMSNIHVASLAGTYTAGFATLYSGSIGTSFGVMLIIKIVYEQGIPLKYSLGGYSAMWCLVIINTLFFLPRYRIQPRIPPMVLEVGEEKKCEPSINEQESQSTSKGHVNSAFTFDSIQDNTEEKKQKVDGQIPNGTIDSSHGDTVEKKPQVSGEIPDDEQKPDTKVPLQKQSLKTTIVSSIFILHLFWFTMIQLKLIMYIGSMNSWLNDIFQRDDKKDKAKPKADYLTKAKTAIPSLVLGSMSVFICGVLDLFVAEVYWTIYIIYTLTVIYRILLYGTCHAFLHLAFPSEQFGVLFGLTYTVGGLVNCLQYPLFIFIRKGHQETMIMNIILLVVTFLTLVHPINIWVQNKIKKKSTLYSTEETEKHRE